MQHEPSKREIALTKFFLHTPAKTIYRSFADSISLQGHEKVLDFGSGYGTVAKWVAPKLTSGQLTCADISSIWQAECRNHLAKYKNILRLVVKKSPTGESTHYFFHSQDDKVEVSC